MRIPDYAPPLRSLHSRDGGANVWCVTRAVSVGRANAHRELGTRTDKRPLLRGRLDPAIEGLADHPCRNNHTASPGQHRSPGWGCYGLARSRMHSGGDGYTHALRFAGWLHATTCGNAAGQAEFREQSHTYDLGSENRRSLQCAVTTNAAGV